MILLLLIILVVLVLVGLGVGERLGSTWLPILLVTIFRVLILNWLLLLLFLRLARFVNNFVDLLHPNLNMLRHIIVFIFNSELLFCLQLEQLVAHDHEFVDETFIMLRRIKIFLFDSLQFLRI